MSPMSEPSQATNPEYEYKAVKLPDAMVLQSVLDKSSKDGWRLVQTVVSMGYTVGLIFERQKGREVVANG
jgi:hypothetical protein